MLFSSVTALLGTPGQANYAAANGTIDGMARRWIRQQVPVLSVQFGPIAGAGMAVRSGVLDKLSAAGIPPLPVEAVVGMLEFLLKDSV